MKAKNRNKKMGFFVDYVRHASWSH